MKKITLIAGIAIFGLLTVTSCKKESTTSAIATPSPKDPNECVTGQSVESPIIPGTYIIELNNGVITGKSAIASMSISEDVLERNDIDQTKVAAVFSGEQGGFIAKLSSEEAVKLTSDPSVKTIEPDRVVSLGTSCFTVAAPTLITWNVKRVGYGDGRGKTAWVLDTGIDFDHPDLNVDKARSRTFITGGTSATDDHGHGTHVAGVIGALNNNIGVLGVASGANLVSLKVLGSDGSGTLSTVIQALSYVNQNASAGDVVNMSFGLDGSSTVLDDQIVNIAARGIYFSIAAGNDGKAANTISPANANGTNIYTVSAVDSLDRFASFSNFGNDVVDYAQPGVNILSTYTNGRYAWMSGTSMATPHLTGLLLLKGRNLNTSGTAKNDPDGTADPIAHF